ncbi:phospholipid-translocating ATPase [Fusarium tjaetaba]|uniref:Phospholipid-translocating ATPase n=1 Tax=Fusarium tjaetaba TaxID=1567544 RepID=A0A8H5SA60_9HYPO|nr:phospholipid-translocating ATPase [Fusarium tjaetaba]KAF5647348.1 phospholipid-translocating ATPase [Fusarium tjaetaba]
MNTTTPLRNGIAAIDFSPLLAPDAIFLSFYSIFLLLHVLIAIRFWRFYGYSIGMVCGILLELVGYCGKVQLSHNRDNKNGYIMYIIGLTLGPTFLSSALYLNISTLQQHYPTSRFTRISPRLFASLFILGDFICLCFIGCGGSLAAIFAENPIGVDLMIAGLAVQVLFTAIFCLALWVICRRSWPEICQEKRYPYVIGLAIASACLFLRSCWRCAELSGGFNGPLASMEGVFFALDSVPMVVMTVTLTIFHPELWLGARKANSGKPICAGNYTMSYVQTKG